MERVNPTRTLLVKVLCCGGGEVGEAIFCAWRSEEKVNVCSLYGQ